MARTWGFAEHCLSQDRGEHSGGVPRRRAMPAIWAAPHCRGACAVRACGNRSAKPRLPVGGQSRHKCSGRSCEHWPLWTYPGRWQPWKPCAPSWRRRLAATRTGARCVAPAQSRVQQAPSGASAMRGSSRPWRPIRFIWHGLTWPRRSRPCKTLTPLSTHTSIGRSIRPTENWRRFPSVAPADGPGTTLPEPVAAAADAKPKAYLPPFRTAEPAEAKVSFVRRQTPSGAANVAAGAEAKAAAGSDTFVPAAGSAEEAEVAIVSAPVRRFLKALSGD